jgi:hypothetical protein
LEAGQFGAVGVDGDVLVGVLVLELFDNGDGHGAKSERCKGTRDAEPRTAAVNLKIVAETATYGNDRPSGR